MSWFFRIDEIDDYYNRYMNDEATMDNLYCLLNYAALNGSGNIYRNSLCHMFVEIEAPRVIEEPYENCPIHFFDGIPRQIEIPRVPITVRVLSGDAREKRTVFSSDGYRHQFTDYYSGKRDYPVMWLSIWEEYCKRIAQAL